MWKVNLKIFVAFCVFMTSLTLPAAEGKLLTVDDDAPANYTSIQPAINYASNGDEIEVRPGTYNEYIDFKGKAVRLYSSGGPEVTTIDANILILLEDFNDGDYAGWAIVDQGDVSGPSVWSAATGEMVQSSNIYTEPKADPKMLGTFAWWQNGMSWTDYQVTLTMKSDDDDAMGVMFRYQDPYNYYRFVWLKQDHTQPVGRRQLVKIQDGQYTVLDEDDVPYTTGQEYEVKIVVSGPDVEVFIDDVSVLSTGDSSFAYGSVALYCWGNVGTYFDDIEVKLPVFHVVQCASGEDPNTILEGFTITGGNANGANDHDKRGAGMHNSNSSPTVINCIFTGNTAERYGGGVENYPTANPVFIDCTFSDNQAGIHAGGMYNYNNSSPTVTNCTFSNNEANGNTTDMGGGGMYNNSSNPVVTNCAFRYNSTDRDGGGIFNIENSNPVVANCTFNSNLANMYGGGMYNDNSSPTVTNCIFSNNSARDCGGGMLNYVSNPTVTNCTFSANWVVFDSGFGGGMENFSSSPMVTNCTFTGNTAQWGGGMDNYTVDYPPGVNSSPTVTNCIFSNNSARDWGGGMCNITARTTVINCTFSNNTAGIDGGGMRNWLNSSTTVTNCILWGDMPDELFNKSSTATVTYSDVQGGYSGAGNIDADPCFIDAVSGDFRLKAGSPCIDAGNNNAIPADTPDLDGDGDTTEPIPFDLNGDPRVWNEIVDMGALEYVDLRVHNVTQNTSYIAIQAAIDDANDYDEIEVRPGTYNEAIDFNGKAVRLYSIAGPNDTTIDGTGNYHVVQCVSGEDANTVLDGFTITGGNANGGIYPNDSGGGMYNDFSSPTVTDCNFSGNSAAWGGGMFNYQSSPTVINCNFSGNPADYGGGMSNYQGSNPTVTDCTFSGNSGYIGGAMCNDQGSNPTVTDCIFLSNAASLHGGGMHNGHSDPKVTNCIFSGNTASAHGGGMMNNYGSVSYTANCVFIGNTANGWGGGMCNASCSPYFINCTFRGNTASSGGAIYSDNSYTNIQNCILWADGANEIVYSSGTMSVTYSDVQGGYSGTGNINADPYFVDAIAGNLRLSSGSPCIDKGSNAALPPDTTDLDGDGDTTEPIPFDLDDGPRVWNGIVDMGAYEYFVAGPPKSSEVDFEYLAILCADWLATS